MAHHSRLAGFIIDCQSGELADSAAFWSQALGLAVVDPDQGGSGRYAQLADGPGDLHIEVQRVEHAPRVHLDIETDDIDAEVARLTTLGATEVSRPHGGRWVVMEAPTGHRFCVVRPQRADFPAGATRWD